MNHLKASVEKFGILDHAPAGMLVIRKDYFVLFWNRCLEDWTKLLRTEIVGKNIGVFFPHFKEPKYCSRIDTIFSGAPPILFSTQLHRHIIPSRLKNGNLRIQRTTITAVPSSDGDTFYALFAVEDVTELTRRLEDYKKAMEEIRTLSGLLPICSYCKKIRDYKGYWIKLEKYISERSNARFSHSICPDCMRKLDLPLDVD